MNDVDLADYMMLSPLTMLIYDLDVKGLWSHDRFSKYVWGYGALHVHCTGRLRLGARVRSYKVLCEVK